MAAMDHFNENPVVHIGPTSLKRPRDKIRTMERSF